MVFELNVIVGVLDFKIVGVELVIFECIFGGGWVFQIFFYYDVFFEYDFFYGFIVFGYWCYCFGIVDRQVF